MQIDLSTVVQEASLDQSASADGSTLLIDKPVAATYQVTPTHERIAFGFDESMVVESSRSGSDLIIELSNGQIIRLRGYFDNAQMDEVLLFTGLEPALLAGSGVASGLGGVAAAGVATSLLVGNGSSDDAANGNVAILTIDPTNGGSLSGTGEPGATIIVTYGDPEQTLSTTVNPTTGGWSIDPLDLPHGTVLTISTIDPGGKTSSPITETVDTGIGGGGTEETGTGTGGSVTIDPTNGGSLSGTGEPGTKVIVTYGDPEQTLSTTVNPTTGGWSIEPLDIPHGTVLTITTVDPGGNTSSPITETVDAEIAAPTVDLLGTTDNTPTLTGTAEANSTVDVTVGGATFQVTADPDGTWSVDTQTATPTSGTFSPLTEGDHDVAVTSTDAAANTASVTTPDALSIATYPLGFEISGSDPVFAGLMTGFELSRVGDVNGDGFEDFAVTTPNEFLHTPTSTNYYNYENGTAGNNFVVFGGPNGQDVDLANLSTSQGFKIAGTSMESGAHISSLGDINGDGLDDVLVSDWDNGTAGGAVVVFGQASGTDVNIGDIRAGTSSAGMALVDPSTSGVGYDVAGLGDINGDSIADFAVSSIHRHASFGTATGQVHVVFGSSSFGNNFDLSTIEGGIAGGFTITGTNLDSLGHKIDNIGDINGDGYNDLIMSAATATGTGNTHIVFGGPNIADVDAADLISGTTDRGFSITGAPTDFASIGDVNGDGLDDMAFATGNALTVVYGRTAVDNISLADVAGNASLGYQITGFPLSATNVSSAGDFNGDGIGDFIVGSPSLHIKTAAGSVDQSVYDEAAYVVFGQEGGTGFDVSGILTGTANGFAITHNAADGDTPRSHFIGGYLGEAVASAGDINGDGFDDILVSAPSFYEYNVNEYVANNEYGQLLPGSSYVIFGNDSGDTSPMDISTITNSAQPSKVVDHAGTTGDDVLSGTVRSELIVGNLGNDTITGGGGADVILAGAGDDRVVVDASNIAALEGEQQFGMLARIDGGTGTDTLALNGSGLTLDFSNIDTGRVEDFEVIDLTGSGNNAMNLSLSDLLNMSDTSNTLRIDGDSGDTVDLTGMTSATVSQETIGTDLYDVYSLGNARLEIHDEVGVDII